MCWQTNNEQYQIEPISQKEKEIYLSKNNQLEAKISTD